MAKLTAEEVTAGLVVQLDVSALVATGRSRTNAEIAEDGDRAVVGEHSFIVLSADGVDGLVRATPVFSRWAPGSELLADSLKSGHRDRWLGVDLYWNRWQHWELRIDDLVAASGPEDTAEGDRRLYAQSTADELVRMLAPIQLNRAPWRAL